MWLHKELKERGGDQHTDLSGDSFSGSQMCFPADGWMHGGGCRSGLLVTLRS